jgi:hypothetical protein
MPAIEHRLGMAGRDPGAVHNLRWPEIEILNIKVSALSVDVIYQPALKANSSQFSLRFLLVILLLRAWRMVGAE